MKKKMKKVAKYILNILNFINMILIGLIPIWNIPYGDEIQKSIIVITGAISTVLVGSKAIPKKEEEDIYEQK